MLRPRGQHFGLGLGLKALASALPRSAAEEPAAKSVCGLTQWRSYLLSQREREIKACHFDHNHINSPVCCHHLILFIHSFIFGLGLDLKALASVSASRFWPRLTSLLFTL